MESLREIAAAFDSEGPAFDHCTITVKGKRRHIAVPNEAMKRLHGRLIGRLRLIEDLEYYLQNSYGALGGGSIVTNAMQHVRNQYFYTVDLRDAYPSTSLAELGQVLRWIDHELGTADEIGSFLARFCAGRNGGLAVGGPASPLLFDLYCSTELDPPIRQICTKATYTRYLDDLTISSRSPIARITRRRIRDVIRRAGFVEHRRKSHLADRMYQSPTSPLTVTGVVITRRGFLRPDRALEKEVRSLLRRMPTGLAPEEFARLRGLAGYLMQFKMPEPEATPKKRKPADPGEWKEQVIPADIRQLQAQLAKRVLRPKVQQRALRTLATRFDPEFLEDLRRDVRIEDVANDLVPGLRKFGREFVACCPFHGEKTSSFTVVPKKGFYHCFGCGCHGDVIRLVEELKGLSFPDAVKLLYTEYRR